MEFDDYHYHNMTVYFYWTMELLHLESRRSLEDLFHQLIQGVLRRIFSV